MCGVPSYSKPRLAVGKSRVCVTYTLYILLHRISTKKSVGIVYKKKTHTFSPKQKAIYFPTSRFFFLHIHRFPRRDIVVIFPDVSNKGYGSNKARSSFIHASFFMFRNKKRSFSDTQIIAYRKCVKFLMRRYRTRGNPRVVRNTHQSI